MNATPFDPSEAQKHKIAFYALPQSIDYSRIDVLMQPILRLINQSGWVWTAECCQGHPDATEPRGWDFNTNPYLRLVVEDGVDLESLLGMLVATCRGHVIELHTVEKGPWVEVLIYIRAHNVFQRNAGIKSLTKFANDVSIGHKIHTQSEPIQQIKPPILLASRLRALAEKIVIDPRFSVAIGSSVTSELQALFKAAADAVDENEELRCQLSQNQETEQITQHPSIYKLRP